MMKQWLIRRAVRRPVSRATTAAISSSVWRLPFISASARPQRTSSTALKAESWLWAASTISKPLMSSPALAAASRIFASGPTRIGMMSLSFAASTALSSEASSQGWAIAVGTAGRLCARSTRRSNLSWTRPSVATCVSGIDALLFGSLRFEVEQLFDPREAAAGFLRQRSVHLDHAAQALQHLPSLFLVSGQKPRDRRDGTVLIETEDQELLLQELLELGHRSPRSRRLRSAIGLQYGES